MKNKLLIAIFTLLTYGLSAQDVTEIYTNYNGFWSSSETSSNPLNPDNSHELLGFTWNGTTYSTGVDDTKLTNNGIGFTPLVVRALPIFELPTSGGGSYFVGLGERLDGIPNGVDPSSTSPFNAITSVTEPPEFLTDGVQGLDLGTGLSNIPSATVARFNLSSAGIDLGQTGGAPDILVSQIASPSGGGDELRFVDNSGVTVGNSVNINFNSEPTVGNWDVDFYRFNSTQPSNGFVNTQRTIKFFAADISDFGITSANVGDAVALLYSPSGSSDPGFLAFNEPAFGIASQLVITNPSPPTQQNCDGTLTPGFFDVQLQDQLGNPVLQAGLEITASLSTGPGTLLGTTTKLTDANGSVTFDDLEFDVGGNHIIEFSFSSLDSAFSTTIADAIGCNDITWTGNTDSQWDVTTNWNPNEIPDGNNAVIIPNGRPNYPILDADAGAGDLTMESDASIVLNGFLLALNGTLTNVSAGATIDASAAGSELFISSADAANLPAGFINADVANFTVENSTGATVPSTMNISEVLDVREGTLNTGGFMTMVCNFTPRQTALLDRLVGTINGDLTVEQCFPARRAFRLVSSSVTTTSSIHDNWQEGATAYNDSSVPNNYGTHITGLGQIAGSGHTSTPGDGDQFQGLDWQTSGNASMFSFNNTTQSWEMVLDTDTPTLTAGEPYRLMIRGARKDVADGLFDITSNAAAPTDTKLRSTGTVLKGPVNQSLPLANGEVAMIGNPFHSIVDMQFVLSNSIGLSQSFVVWDPTLGGTPTVGSPGGRGAFVTVNVTSNTNTNSSSEMLKFLQPYQAAFVTSTTVASSSLTFEESYKNVSANQVDVFSTLPSPHYINMMLFDQLSFNNNDTSDDGLVIYFSPNFTNIVDDNDAPKFFNIDENIARNENNDLISYENRAMPQVDEVLELFTTQYRTTDYVFQVEVGDFPDNSVYLYDNYTDTETLLNNNAVNTHNFSVDQSIAESIATDRFEIRFDVSTLSNDDFDISKISVYPNPANEILNINLGENASQLQQISLFDLNGRLINQIKIDNDNNLQNQIDVSNLSSGVYLLEVKTQNDQFKTKVIVD